MLALLSPAKSLAEDRPAPTRKWTQPRMLHDAEALVEVMRSRSVNDVATLMNISEDLAHLNVQRFADFEVPFTTKNATQSSVLFDGDVYQGMGAATRFNERDFTEAQKTVRILSGLYGVLRPLDLIQPYRLEMGTALATDRGDDLYDWWGDQVTALLRSDLEASPGAKAVINLASNEYAKVVDASALSKIFITPRFEDQAGDGQYKIISFYAKRARGQMAAWLVLNRVRTVKAITDFDDAGYRYHEPSSTPEIPVFRRAKSDIPN